MKEFTFEEVQEMIDNLEPKINGMSIEEFNTMVINDVKIMNYIQKFIPLLDFNCAINLFRSDVVTAFNLDMIYGKDGILLNKVPLDPDNINLLKEEFKGEYYSKTRVVSFRVINVAPKVTKYYIISIDGTMYDVTDNSRINSTNLDTFTKNRIISVYMLYHNMLHNWIQSNICNLDVPKENNIDEGKMYNANKIVEMINEIHATSKYCNGVKLYNTNKVAELINAIDTSSILYTDFSDKKSSDKHTNETKNFNFGMVYKMHGMKTVKVPKDFTLEQAKQYVREHWDEIDLPRNADYISDSDEPDFGICDFDECW